MASIYKDAKERWVNLEEACARIDFFHKENPAEVDMSALGVENLLDDLAVGSDRVINEARCSNDDCITCKYGKREVISERKLTGLITKDGLKDVTIAGESVQITCKYNGRKDWSVATGIVKCTGYEMKNYEKKEEKS